MTTEHEPATATPRKTDGVVIPPDKCGAEHTYARARPATGILRLLCTLPPEHDGLHYDQGVWWS